MVTAGVQQWDGEPRLCAFVLVEWPHWTWWEEPSSNSRVFLVGELAYYQRWSVRKLNSLFGCYLFFLVTRRAKDWFLVMIWRSGVPRLFNNVMWLKWLGGVVEVFCKAFFLPQSLVLKSIVAIFPEMDSGFLSVSIISKMCAKQISSKPSQHCVTILMVFGAMVLT